MLIGEWIGLVGLLATNTGVSIGIYKYFNSRLEKLNTDTDQKINRIYETQNKYVLKDLCKVMHENNSENLTGLEMRITNNFKDLNKKVDDNFKMVMDLLKK